MEHQETQISHYNENRVIFSVLFHIDICHKMGAYALEIWCWPLW